MKTYETILIENSDGVIILTINRPKALNALNATVFDELNQLFAHDLLEIEGLKGVIITGSGDRAFVAGADIKEFLELGDIGGEALSQKGHRIFLSIENFKKPVIAAVNGFALGGGCELAMACHMRIADEKAKFGQPEVNLGIIPGYGGTQRLIQLVGKGKAMELMMTADMVGADEAVRLGLANHKVGPGEAVHKAKEIIEKISHKAPLAIAKIVETTQAYFDLREDGFASEVSHFGALSRSEDFKEGANAFIEKRKATFQNK